MIPELGPSLGRLTEPPADAADGAGLRLDDIRLRLVTGVFDLAGAARGFAAAGDAQGARSSLSRVAWLALWEKALASAAERIAHEPGLRDRLVAAGRTRAREEFDHRVMARRCLEIYGAVLAPERSRSGAPEATRAAGGAALSRSLS